MPKLLIKTCMKLCYIKMNSIVQRNVDSVSENLIRERGFARNHDKIEVPPFHSSLDPTSLAFVTIAQLLLSLDPRSFS